MFKKLILSLLFITTGLAKEGVNTFAMELTKEAALLKPVMTSPASQTVQAPKVNVPDVSSLKRMAEFAAAAYCGSTKLSSWTCSHCAKGTSVVGIYKDPASESRMYVAVDEDQKNIVLGFRGPSSLRSWLEDTRAALAPSTGEMKVHSGFLSGANAFKPFYMDKLKPGYSVSVVGHSLGGAIAEVVYTQIKSSLKDRNVSLYTFGEPRVGNLAFTQSVDMKQVYRVVSEGDPVPMMPSKDKGYSPHQQEYFYSSPATYKCTSDCMAFSKKIIPENHLAYYNISMGSGC